MPPKVACALVDTSTGNQSPCGLISWLSRSSTRPGSTVAVRAATSTPRMLPKCARRLSALAGSRTTRENGDAKVAGQGDRRRDVGLVLRHEYAGRHDLVYRCVGGIATARSLIKQHFTLGLTPQPRGQHMSHFRRDRHGPQRWPSCRGGHDAASRCVTPVLSVCCSCLVHELVFCIQICKASGARALPGRRGQPRRRVHA